MAASRIVSLLSENAIEHLRRLSAKRGRHPTFDLYGLPRGCRSAATFSAALVKALDARDRDAIQATLVDLPIHPAAAAMMKVAGVDPVDVGGITAMSGTNMDFTLEGGAIIGTYADLLDARLIASIHLYSDIIWEQGVAGERGHSIEIFRPLPEMIKAALPGRPLRDLVSHPIVDPLGMTIAHVEDYEKNGSLIVHLGYEPKNA